MKQSLPSFVDLLSSLGLNENDQQSQASSLPPPPPPATAAAPLTAPTSTSTASTSPTSASQLSSGHARPEHSLHMRTDSWSSTHSSSPSSSVRFSPLHSPHTQVRLSGRHHGPPNNSRRFAPYAQPVRDLNDRRGSLPILSVFPPPPAFPNHSSTSNGVALPSSSRNLLATSSIAAQRRQRSGSLPTLLESPLATAASSQYPHMILSESIEEDDLLDGQDPIMSSAVTSPGSSSASPSYGYTFPAPAAPSASPPASLSSSAQRHSHSHLSKSSNTSTNRLGRISHRLSVSPSSPLAIDGNHQEDSEMQEEEEQDQEAVKGIQARNTVLGRRSGSNSEASRQQRPSAVESDRRRLGATTATIPSAGRRSASPPLPHLEMRLPPVLVPVLPTANRNTNLSSSSSLVSAAATRGAAAPSAPRSSTTTTTGATPSPPSSSSSPTTTRAPSPQKRHLAPRTRLSIAITSSSSPSTSSAAGAAAGNDRQHPSSSPSSALMSPSQQPPHHPQLPSLPMLSPFVAPGAGAATAAGTAGGPTPLPPSPFRLAHQHHHARSQSSGAAGMGVPTQSASSNSPIGSKLRTPVLPALISAAGSGSNVTQKQMSSPVEAQPKATATSTMDADAEQASQSPSQTQVLQAPAASSSSALRSPPISSFIRKSVSSAQLRHPHHAHHAHAHPHHHWASSHPYASAYSRRPSAAGLGPNGLLSEEQQALSDLKNKGKTKARVSGDESDGEKERQREKEVEDAQRYKRRGSLTLSLAPLSLSVSRHSRALGHPPASSSVASNGKERREARRVVSHSEMSIRSPNELTPFVTRSPQSPSILLPQLQPQPHSPLSPMPMAIPTLPDAVGLVQRNMMMSGTALHPSNSNPNLHSSAGGAPSQSGKSKQAKTARNRDRARTNPLLKPSFPLPAAGGMALPTLPVLAPLGMGAVPVERRRSSIRGLGSLGRLQMRGSAEHLRKRGSLGGLGVGAGGTIVPPRLDMHDVPDAQQVTPIRRAFPIHSTSLPTVPTSASSSPHRGPVLSSSPAAEANPSNSGVTVKQEESDSDHEIDELQDDDPMEGYAGSNQQPAGQQLASTSSPFAPITLPPPSSYSINRAGLPHHHRHQSSSSFSSTSSRFAFRPPPAAFNKHGSFDSSVSTGSGGDSSRWGDEDDDWGSGGESRSGSFSGSLPGVRERRGTLASGYEGQDEEDEEEEMDVDDRERRVVKNTVPLSSSPLSSMRSASLSPYARPHGLLEPRHSHSPTNAFVKTERHSPSDDESLSPQYRASPTSAASSGSAKAVPRPPTLPPFIVPPPAILGTQRSPSHSSSSGGARTPTTTVISGSLSSSRVGSRSSSGSARPSPPSVVVSSAA
ncbi:hypothetical protein DL93DRAFT_1171587 [Clavulina sp. PMI_390]|nr:hypothetical protein DL93DRAFT_1171587 [Clavulina sp. PMI_390]